MSYDYTAIDPETGYLVAIVENTLVDFPCLKQKDTRFCIALLRWDGAVMGWFSHYEGTDFCWYETLSLESREDIPLLSRQDTMRAIIRLRGEGWVAYVHPESHDLTEVIARAKVSLQAKTYKDQTILVAKYSKQLLGRKMRPRQVWNDLPKEGFGPELGALYAKAIKLQLAESEAQG